MWKNSLRTPQWLFLSIQWTELWELQTSLQWLAHASVFSRTLLDTHKAPGSLQKKTFNTQLTKHHCLV